MGRLGTITNVPKLRFSAILLLMLIPLVLGNNAYATDVSFEQLEEKISKLNEIISNEENTPLGKLNFELISINDDFEELQNSIKTSNDYFEFGKYKKLTNQYLASSNQIKEKLADEQKDMEMDDVLLSIQIRKNISLFQNSDRQITNHIHTQSNLEKERLLSDSRKYIQNTLTNVVVQKHFESYSPIINWLDVYKDTFKQIQSDKKFHAIPMTIDRLMLQYDDEELLHELLLLRLDIELLIDATTDESTYTEDDDPPPPPYEEEPEGEEPPSEIIPSPKMSLDRDMDDVLNSQISSTIAQITNIVYEHEKELKDSLQRTSSSSSSSKSFGSGSGGSGETGSGVGDRPRDDNKADF